MDCRAEREFHSSFLQLFGNGARIWNGAGQTIQLCNDQHITLAKGGESLVSRPGCSRFVPVNSWSV